MKKLVLLTMFTMVMSLFGAVAPVSAAGVAVTPGNAEVALSTATDVTFSWTASATSYVSGNTIVLSLYDSAMAPVSTVAACGTPTTAIGGGAVSAGFATNTATFTYTASQTGTAMSACVKVPSIATKGVYSMALTSVGGPADFGSTLLYVDNGNDVNVSATVSPALQMALSAYTCNLGVLSPSSVSSCSYTLSLGTNAANGLTTQVTSGGALTNGSYNYPAATGAAITAGTEKYGFVVSGGAGLTVAGSYATADQAVPTSATTFLSSTAPVAYVASTVTHHASATINTPTGSYTQLVTYTTTASF